MSAQNIMETIQETKELPVWTVHGVNWQADVPLNELNASLDLESQAMEAATKALSAFKGRNNGIVIKLDDGETDAAIGTTMIVHPKDTDPTKGLVAFTHMIFANDGFYKEANEMARAFVTQMAAIQEEQVKEEAARVRLEQELKNFEKIKKGQSKRGKKSKKPIDKSPSGE